MSVTIYGIRTCDTMRKATRWLTEHGVDHRFHDYRADGLDRTTLERWVRKVGWEALLNRSSATFRSLPDERKSVDGTSAVDLMLEQPTMVKRPVLEVGDRLEVGFRPDAYDRLFLKT